MIKKCKRLRRVAKTIITHYFISEYIHDKYLTNAVPINLPIPKQQLPDNRVIWQYWEQGLDENTPPVVRACLNSVVRHKGEYEVRVLTYESIKEYIDLPEFVYEKYECNKEFRTAFFADILRLYLLSAYGGIWIDATVYMTDRIPNEWLNSELFMFERAQRPNDYEFWENYNPEYFSWNKYFRVRVLNSFIIAKKGNVLITKMLSALTAYWKYETKFKHYFLFQIIFCELTKNNYHAKFSDVPPHEMARHIYDAMDRESFLNLKRNSPVHKLSYFDCYKAGTIFEYVLGENFCLPHKMHPKIEQDVTFCSMLFRIHSKNLNKMKHEDRNFQNFYLKSLQSLSERYRQFVLWCDQETADYLIAHKCNVVMKVLKFEDLPWFSYRKIFIEYLYEMKKNSFNEGYLLKNLAPEEVVDYIILVLSKIDVLYWAKQQNPFNSQYFFWMDAGTCNEVYSRYWYRFTGEMSFDTSKFKCCFMSCHQEICRSLIEISSYQDVALIKAPFEISASQWVIPFNKVDKFYEKYCEAIAFLLSKKLISTEQSVFSTMLKLGNEDLFEFSKTENYRQIVHLISQKDSSQPIKNDCVHRSILFMLLKITRVFRSSWLENLVRQKILYSHKLYKVINLITKCKK